MEDREIVDLFLGRNEFALMHVSEKYGKRLRLLSQRIVNDEQTAEECENDTYVKTWNSIPPNEPRDYLFAFMAKITRQLSLNCCRDRKRLKRNAYICELNNEMQQCIPSAQHLEHEIDDIELQRALNSFLSALTKEKRNVFLRRYWYCDSIADISKRFSISESKVKTMLFRTRNLLREYLEEEGYFA